MDKTSTTVCLRFSFTATVCGSAYSEKYIPERGFRIRLYIFILIFKGIFKPRSLHVIVVEEGQISFKLKRKKKLHKSFRALFELLHFGIN